MREFIHKFLNDMHFFRSCVTALLTWVGLAMVSPAGRTIAEKLIYSLPAAAGVGIAAVGAGTRKP